MPITVYIQPFQPTHFEGLYAVLDRVTRETHLLDFTEAPPRAELEAFYLDLYGLGWPHFVALDEGNSIVGWTTVAPCTGQTRAHVGTVGIGLLPAWRGQGNGTRLLHAAIRRAWQIGLTRLELTVRADNTPAIALYRRLGFEEEGRLRNGMQLEHGYADMLLMACLAPTIAGMHIHA